MDTTKVSGFCKAFFYPCYIFTNVTHGGDVKKVMLFLTLISLIVSGQITPTEIPWPTEIPPDYIMQSERHYYDFDGDGR